MKRNFKTFSVIISILFISLFFIFPIKTRAASNTYLMIDYENEIFQDFYIVNINPVLDDAKNYCYNALQTDEILLAYRKSSYHTSVPMFTCYDVKNQNLSSYVTSTSSTSNLIIKFSSSFNFINFEFDFAWNSGKKTQSSVLSLSSLFYTTSTFVEREFQFELNTYEIPIYTDKEILFNIRTSSQSSYDYNNGLFINGEYIQDGEYYSFYNLKKEYIKINDKCSTFGECLSHELELVVEVPQDDNWYNLHYYTEDGKLDKNIAYTDGGGYEVSIDLELYHDTTLYVDFQKLVCPSEDNCTLETLQLLEYEIDVLYSDPTIKYTLSETEENYHLAIDYKLPLDYLRSDYFFQYRVGNGEWILCTKDELQLLEFDLGKNYYIEARILDGYQKILAYSSFNINTSVLPFVRFEMIEDSQEYQNVKVFISNVLADGYSYSWDSGSGLTGPFDLSISKEEVIVLQSRFGRTSDLIVNIYDSDNNVVGTFSLNIPVKRVPTIYDLDSSDSIFSYLTNYIDGMSADLKEFGNGLQDIVDEISGTSIEQILVIILIIMCLITTIKLGGS